MQKFTIAEIICMLTGKICEEPNHKLGSRNRNAMLDMCSRFGGSFSDTKTARSNARQHTPETITQMVDLEMEAGTDIHDIRDAIIDVYGGEIELPIEDSGSGTFIA